MTINFKGTKYMWRKIIDFLKFDNAEEEHQKNMREIEMQHQKIMQELIGLIEDINKTEKVVINELKYKNAMEENKNKKG